MNWTPKRLQNRRIPPLFHDADLTDFRDELIEKLEPLVAPKNVLIQGGNGVGKSHLAAALALLWDAEWCDVCEFSIELRHCQSRLAEHSEAWWFNFWVGREVMVVDDLLAAARTEFVVAWLLAVINGRLNRKLPTIVTTDRTFEAIADTDSSLASRLASFRRIKLTGPDRRWQ